MSDTSFEVKRAYHAKQSAYKEMAEARDKMNGLHAELTKKYAECEDLQNEYNQAKADVDAAWEQYNADMLAMKEKIGEKITSVSECNKLEENMQLMAENKEEIPAKAEVYEEARQFFAKLAAQKLVERDELIAKKRALERPDDTQRNRMLARLKQLRTEHSEILEKYHNAKNDYSLKRQVFEQEKAKYDRSRGMEVEAKSSRPVELGYNEGLLMKSSIPEKYWSNCRIEQRADGKIDFYYGADVNVKHGHVVMASDGSIEHRRPPEKAC